MRIRFPKGMKCIEALEEAIQFFEENMEDYPYLRSDMHIYLYLKDADGKICTLNDTDYRFDGRRIVDATEERIEIGKKKLKACLNEEIQRLSEAVSDAEVILERYKKYLHRAEEKGFKTAETWRYEIEELKKRIDGECSERVRIAEKLKQCVEEHELVFHIDTETDSYNKVTALRILVEIDPKCKVFADPLYYIPENFFFHRKPDVSNWFEA